MKYYFHIKKGFSCGYPVSYWHIRATAARTRKDDLGDIRHGCNSSHECLKYARVNISITREKVQSSRASTLRVDILPRAAGAPTETPRASSAAYYRRRHLHRRHHFIWQPAVAVTELSTAHTHAHTHAQTHTHLRQVRTRAYTVRGRSSVVVYLPRSSSSARGTIAGRPTCRVRHRSCSHPRVIAARACT